MATLKLLEKRCCLPSCTFAASYNNNARFERVNVLYGCEQYLPRNGKEVNVGKEL